MKKLKKMAVGVACLGVVTLGLGIYNKNLAENTNYDNVKLADYGMTLKELQDKHDSIQRKFKEMQEIFDGEKEGSVVLSEEKPGWELEVQGKDGVVGKYVVTTYTDKETEEKVTRIDVTDAEGVVYASSEVVLDTTLKTDDVMFVVSKQMTKFTPTLKMDLDSIETNLNEVEEEVTQKAEKNYKWALATFFAGIVILAVVFGLDIVGSLAYGALGFMGVVVLMNMGVIGMLIAHIKMLLELK